MFSYLDFCCYFEANGQNRTIFCMPIQVLKNSIWHDIFSLSDHFPASWNLHIPRDLPETEEQLLIFSSSLTPGRVKRLLKSNPQVNHRIHLKDSYVS